MSRKFLALLPVLALLISAAFVPGSATAAAPERLGPNPTVAIEVKDAHGQPMKGVQVILHSDTDGKWLSSSVTDASGAVTIKSAPPALDLPDYEIVDHVYTAYIKMPNGDLIPRTFAVPHPKDLQHMSATALEKLEKNRAKHLTLTASDAQAQPKAPAATQPATSGTVTPAGDMSWYDPNQCYEIGWDDFICERQVTQYQATTTIGTYALSSGLHADLVLDSSAETAIDYGYKTPGGMWSASGNVTLTNGKSSDWHWDGVCTQVGSNFTCDPMKTALGEFKYEYKDMERYYQDQLYSHWYEVNPLYYIGPSYNQGQWGYAAGNGKPISDVLAGSYGDHYDIWDEAGHGFTYTFEMSFGVGAEISTPVGTFSAGVTGKHESSNDLHYSTSSGTRYVIYDYGTGGGMWYSTY